MLDIVKVRDGLFALVSYDSPSPDAEPSILAVLSSFTEAFSLGFAVQMLSDDLDGEIAYIAVD